MSQYTIIKYRIWKVVSRELAGLISAQQNLKYLKILQSHDCAVFTADIITSLTKFPNTLITIYLYEERHRFTSHSFIAKYTHLQEIILSFYEQDSFEDFGKLQYVPFSRLQVLKFEYKYPKYELLINFLKNNGKGLKEFYLTDSDNSLYSAMVKFYPKLKRLFTDL